jgi:hypothetical protein
MLPTSTSKASLHDVPQLAHLADGALLLLRVMVGIVFILCSNDAANIAGALGFENSFAAQLTRSYPRHFTFYVARPTRSIHQNRVAGLRSR